MSEAFRYVFTWHALSDACPKCRSLNETVFENDRIYNEVVWDGRWGDVWDLNRGSLAHPNCRCQLELTSVTVDTDTLFSDLKATLLELKDHLLAMKRK